MGHLAAQTNNQLETKQEIQWVIRPTTPRLTLISWWVIRPVPPPPSEAALPGQPALGSLETALPVGHQPILRQPMVCQPILCQPVVNQPYSIHLWFVSPVIQFPHCCPLSPARLERARSNPLTPGTPVHPPQYPDWTEPIKLSYKRLQDA